MAPQSPRKVSNSWALHRARHGSIQQALQRLDPEAFLTLKQLTALDPTSCQTWGYAADKPLANPSAGAHPTSFPLILQSALRSHLLRGPARPSPDLLTPCLARVASPT